MQWSKLSDTTRAELTRLKQHATRVEHVEQLSHYPKCFEKPANSLSAFLEARKGSSSAASSSSAAQAALSEVKIECIQDVQRWLSAGKVSSGNPEIGSVREAVAALTRAPRPRAEDVRPLLGKWRVEQRQQRKHRPLPEIIRDLEDKVIRAAQKLQAELANKPVEHTSIVT